MKLKELFSQKMVADDRCPVCGTKLRKVRYHCVGGNQYCVDCGGMRYQLVCPNEKGHEHDKA